LPVPGERRRPSTLTGPSERGIQTRPRALAQVAQSVEQGTENPRVGGSIPPLGIFNIGTSRSKLSDANRFKIPTVLRRTELRRSLLVRLDAVKRALQDGDASRLTDRKRAPSSSTRWTSRAWTKGRGSG